MIRILLRLALLGLAALSLLACRPAARPATSALQPAPAAAAPQPQLGPGRAQWSGRLLFVKDNNLWLWDEGGARQMTDGGTWRQPSWAPDGRRIAYVYEGDIFTEIFVLDPTEGTNERLTRSQATYVDDHDWSLRPVWSPDAKQIAYLSDAASYNPMPWLMNADGSRKRPLIQPSGARDAADAMSWSPDGTQLAVALFQGPTSQISLFDFNRGTLRQLTSWPKGALDPAWSPDGRFLAYAAREDAGLTIHVVRADGSGDRAVSQGSPDRAPAWSPDGRTLAFLSARTGSFELWTVDLQSDGGGLAAAGPERQWSRDLGIDAVSGLSWAR